MSFIGAIPFSYKWETPLLIDSSPNTFVMHMSEGGMTLLTTRKDRALAHSESDSGHWVRVGAPRKGGSSTL